MFKLINTIHHKIKLKGKSQIIIIINIQTISSKIGNNARLPILNSHIQHNAQNLSYNTGIILIYKRDKTGKERTKLSLISCDIIHT